MIATVFRIGLLRLWHNRLELALAFVVPIVFFSIFAVIFGGQLGRGLSAVKVALVDEDQTDFSRQIAGDLAATTGLKIVRHPEGGVADELLTADQSERLLQQGRVAIAVVLPAGLSGVATSNADAPLEVRLLADSSDPVAAQLVAGRLREAMMTRQGEVLARRGARRARVAKLALRLRGTSATVDPEENASNLPLDTLNLTAGWNMVTVDVLGRSQSNPVVAMYAAGIAVLFLLFTTTATAGTLLEEAEAGTLERLLTSRLSLGQLLAGKWLWTMTLGFVQTTVMFVWGWLAFGIDLPGKISGFLVMTVCTTAAAASLALCLAAVCRSRQQLNGVSMIVILSMSALGGSMVPRYVMSEALQRAGLITFNA
ncbi:MAG: ABC transporter permease, partial [Planctomycetales bacterium]